MKVIKYINNEDWLSNRKGKITGSRLGSIVGKKGNSYKIGFYELIAERLSVSEDEFEGYIPNETPMDRGTRLEKYAIDRFSKETDMIVTNDKVMWVREDNDNIAISPDGIIDDEQAVEVKCLSSARHIEAFLNNAVPDEYEAQVIQYFVVNDKLQRLFFVCYDPRIPAKDFFYIIVNRHDIEEEIAMYRKYQDEVLKEVDEIVTRLSPL
jgi:putative phage-type endonuclease